MPDSLKLGVSLLILASIFFLCVSVALFLMKENEREKRISLEAKLNDILKAKDELSRNLEELKLVNTDLDSKIENAYSQIKSISEDYAREKEARELLMAELDKEKEETKRLVNEIMGEKEEKVGLVQKLAQAENDYQRLKEQLNIIVQAKETLEKKVKEIIAQKGVELEKIVIQTDTPVSVSSAPERYDDSFTAAAEGETKEAPADGEVLIVNSKFEFVVVNLGKLDGLELGDRLGIYRNGDLIREAQIEKLYDRMSAAALLPQNKKAAVRQGDRVFVTR